MENDENEPQRGIMSESQTQAMDIRAFFAFPYLVPSNAVRVFHRLLTDADREFLRDCSIKVPRY